MHDENSAGRVISFFAGSADGGITVKDFLRKNGVSRSLMTSLKKEENGIALNGSRAKTIEKINAGDVVEITLPDSSSESIGACADKKISVPVLYEDEDVIVFDKPANMPVHPSQGHRGDTLGDCFAAMYGGLSFRPVNRLDKDTSGLCLAAKNAHAANMLQGKIRKVYYAAVCGKIESGGIIDAPIGRAENSIIKREVRPGGKPSVTEYEVIKSSGKYTLLRITLRTGRTHQIRVHFSHIGFPLAGDDLYGGDISDIKEQALHCGEMNFISPVSGKEVTVISPLRKEIEKLFIRAES